MAAEISRWAERLTEIGRLPVGTDQIKAIEALEQISQALSQNLSRRLLDVARQLESHRDRARALTTVVDKLPKDQQPEVFREALHAARQVEIHEDRAQVLNFIADKLPPEDPAAFEEALNATHHIQTLEARAYALRAMAEQLPPEQSAVTREALYATRRIRSLTARLGLLSTLAQKLPALQQAQVWEEIQHITRQVDTARERAQLFWLMVEQLGPEQLNSQERAQVLEEALQAATQIKEHRDRAYAVSHLLTRFPPDQQAAVCRVVLEAITKIEPPDDRAHALKNLIDQLPTTPFPEQAALLPSVLQIARQLQQPEARADALTAVALSFAPRHSQPIFAEALQAVRTVMHQQTRVNLLSALAQGLPPRSRLPVLEEALWIAHQVEDHKSRVYALSTIVHQLPPKQQVEVLCEALYTAKQVVDPWKRANTLRVVAKTFPPKHQVEVLRSALHAARQIEDLWKRTYALVYVVEKLPPEQQLDVLGEALHTAAQVDEQWLRADAVTYVANQFPLTTQLDTLQQARRRAQALALTQAQGIDNPRQRILTLGQLAKSLEASQQEQVWQEILETITSWTATEDIVTALHDLAQYLPTSQEGLVRRWLEIAQQIEDYTGRMGTILAIAPHLSTSQREQLLPKSFPPAHAIPFSKGRASYACGLAALIPDALERLESLNQALEVIQQDHAERRQTQAIRLLAPQLVQLQAAVATLPTTEQVYREECGRMLTLLLNQTMLLAHSIADLDDRVRAVAALVPLLPQPENLVQQYSAEVVLDVIRAQPDDRLKTQTLSAVAPLLPAGLLSNALQLIADRSIQDGALRAEAFGNLAPYLASDELLSEALQLLDQQKGLRESLVDQTGWDEELSQSNLGQGLQGGFQGGFQGFNRLRSPQSGAQPAFTRSRERATALGYVLNYLTTPHHYLVAYEIAMTLPIEYRSQSCLAIAQALTSSRFVSLLQTPSLISSSTAQLPISSFATSHFSAADGETQQDELTTLVALLWQQLERQPNPLFYDNHLLLFAAIIPALNSSQLQVASQLFMQWVAIAQQQHTFSRDLSGFQQVTAALAQRWRAGCCFEMPVHHPLSYPYQPLSRIAYQALQPLAQHLKRNSEAATLYRCLLGYLGCTVEQARALIEPIGDLATQVTAWVELACHAVNPEQPLDQVLQLQYIALQQIELLSSQPGQQAQLIDRLVPFLAPKHVNEASRVTKSIKRMGDRVQALVSLALRFPLVRDAAQETLNILMTQKGEDRIHLVAELSRLAVEMPELLPTIFKLLEDPHYLRLDRLGESWSETIDRLETETYLRLRAERYPLLLSVQQHLPVRIVHELHSRLCCTDDLWQRALTLLRRGYRNALKEGSLRNESDRGADTLDLQHEIEALTDLLLIRDLSPPMTVGILGGWGGGKSYIMHLMQQRMTEIRSAPVTATAAWGQAGNPDPHQAELSPYVGHIYQIKFDAWTFAKSNLWASLMQTIFFELNRQITIEQQLASALAKSDTPAGRAEALRSTSHYWKVLYEASEVDQQEFLTRILSQSQLERLTANRLTGKFEDILWQKLGQTYQEEDAKFTQLQQQLEAKRELLAQEKHAIRQTIEADQLAGLIDEATGITGTVLANRVSQIFFEQLRTEIQAQVQEQLQTENPDEAAAPIDLLALQTTIQQVVFCVFEKHSDQLNLQSLICWTQRNWRSLSVLILLVVLTVLVALFIQQIVQFLQIETFVPQLLTTLTAIVPLLGTTQQLLQSLQTWFDETNLAVQEYGKKVTDIPEKIEAKRDDLFQKKLDEVDTITDLETEIAALEEKVATQRDRIPKNQYASLEAFVNERLQGSDYSQHLGLMHQVRDDLADLSRRLLPPSNLQEFGAKLQQLKEVFPRGPARVVVYIDDLDRCPPDRVVEVLEAVQLLVQTPLFIAVLAIDERYITRALEHHYQGILSRYGHPSASDYLEKIIQLPYRVRPISTSALNSYLRSQILIQDQAIGSPKFNEFSRDEFKILLYCCRHVDLSPRTLKRLTNVYKLFKIVCRTRGRRLSFKQQKAILALLALSGRYPDLIRGIFKVIGACFEEDRNPEKAEKISKQRQKVHDYSQLKFVPHQDSQLSELFTIDLLPSRNLYAKHEVDQLMHDAHQTGILPQDFTLKDLTYELFNLVRSFSFVGEIGDDFDSQ